MWSLPWSRALSCGDQHSIANGQSSQSPIQCFGSKECSHHIFLWPEGLEHGDQSLKFLSIRLPLEALLPHFCKKQIPVTLAVECSDFACLPFFIFGQSAKNLFQTWSNEESMSFNPDVKEETWEDCFGPSGSCPEAVRCIWCSAPDSSSYRHCPLELANLHFWSLFWRSQI